MNQATGTDYDEVEQAVDTAKQMVRDQLTQLRAEQDRLTTLLRLRKTDLTSAGTDRRPDLS